MGEDTSPIKNILGNLELILNEVALFAEGKGDHFIYAYASGPYLIVPKTRDIINYLVQQATPFLKLIPLDLKATFEKRIDQSYLTFEKSYKESGDKDGYLVEDRGKQVLGHNLCGG